MPLNEYEFASDSNHLAEFAGLPVVDFHTVDIEWERLRKAGYRWGRGEPAPEYLPPDPAYLAALADPASVAWRLRTESYEPQETIRENLPQFMSAVDTTQVTALLIGCWVDPGNESAVVPRDLLVEYADRFPALRALFFVDVISEESELSWILQCDVVPLLAAFPDLEELAVRGGDGLEFPATSHAALRKLFLETGGLPREVTTGILASDLPALEHLKLWFGAEEYGGTTTVDDLAPLLAGEVFPALHSLGLCNSEWGDELVRRLAEAPVVERVRVLDLSGNVLTDEGGEVLATAPAFRHLERLVMRYHFVSDAVLDRIREALPDADLDLSPPEEPDDYDLDDDNNEVPVYYPLFTE